jgi:ATP-dependent Clp protease ATP-binding subunit ClpC
VRRQPFSVVLLDEFEKAHAKIWDLFLQVFDEGRLTDTHGRTADFRHCLIILTTNLGATAHASAMVGFAPGEASFVDEQIHQAIRQTYRPEFQNRLDKVIVFRPLARAQMRLILKKELALLLARRGLKDRAWAVEWEASAQEFLLEKGFSPEMGARPLKRAIEHYVVAPLAATIVERRFPEGEQFVFVRSDGKAIQAEFVDPDAPLPADAEPAPQAASARPALAAMALAPAGTLAELEALAAEQADITATLASASWEELKAELLGQMRAPAFWSQPERFATLARLALMDRVAAATETALALESRLTRGKRSDKVSRELVARLALQLWLVKAGIADAFEGAPIEVALAVEPALEGDAVDGDATRAWCARLRAMYRGWAEARHMQVADLPRAAAEAPTLLVAGFGAHRVLAREVGLHVLEGDDGARVAARVRLAVAPLGDPPPAKLQAAIAAEFARAERPAIVRRYRGAPAPLVRNADGRWRTGKLDLVLRGNFDLIAGE